MDVREKLVELLDNFHRDLSPFAGNEKLFVVDDNVEQAEYLIEHGVTVQEWISVKDRLPEKHDRFICTYKFNSNSEMQFVGVLDYYASDQYPHWQHESAGVIVTHWMPLPKPPKGE